MSASISFYGRLTKDPVFNKYNNQDCLRLAVASRTTRKMEDGNYLTNFYDVTVWGQRASYLNGKISKGSLVSVEGEFYAMPYESKQTKEQKISLQVSADRCEMLSPSAQSSGSQPKAQPQQAPQGYQEEDDDEDPF